MTFETYLSAFKDIIDNARPPAPYDNPDYLDYTILNWSRMNRWLKKGVLDAKLINMVNDLPPQQWIVITEPWCGDAAHSVPFLHLLAVHNAQITVEYERRDSPPYLIHDYLTNGSKSIPKLIIRDESGQDIAIWGPRPLACQTLYDGLIAEKADFNTVKATLQKWYNADKGSSLQDELKDIIAGFGR